MDPSPVPLSTADAAALDRAGVAIADAMPKARELVRLEPEGTRSRLLARQLLGELERIRSALELVALRHPRSTDDAA